MATIKMTDSGLPIASKFDDGDIVIVQRIDGRDAYSSHITELLCGNYTVNHSNMTLVPNFATRAGGIFSTTPFLPLKELSGTFVIRDEKAMVEVRRARKASKFISNDFVTLNDYFKVSRGIYDVVKRNIEKGTNTLLLGPTGVGKTELAANLATSLGLPLTIFDMGTMRDPIMGLVGTHTIKVTDGIASSAFCTSRFSEVIQKPGVVLLDEISRASATANNLLFPCLDFRKELPMEYSFHNTEPIKVHPKCVFIATANLGSQYTGTHKLDRALLDRFMLIEIDPLDKTRIMETIKFHTTLSLEQIAKITECFLSINKAHDDYTISFNLSLRHLKMIAELVEDGFTIYDSFYVICKGIGSKEGLKTLESILNVVKTS